MNVPELRQQIDAARDAVMMYQSRNADMGTIKAAVQKVLNLEQQLERAQGGANFNAALDRITDGMLPRAGGGRSLGDQFVNSPTYKEALKNKSNRGGTWYTEASELFDFDVRSATLTTDAASGGDLIVADFRPGILPLPQQALMVADLIPSATTDSNLITYMKETTFTNAAAAVAEGAEKPEATVVFDATSDRVEKIAHWLPVTDEMLEDLPAIRGYVDSRLRLGVQLTEQDQLLNGDGTSPNISGILDRTGLAADVARGADTNVDAIARQVAAIETATRLQVSGIIIHPTNWLTIQLTKDANGQYYGGGPFAGPAQRFLWGKPVAVTPAITLNTALVGCFRDAAQIFRKGGIRVDVSNSHSDFFVKNLTAIRAEERLALAVYRASGFGEVTGLN